MRCFCPLPGAAMPGAAIPTALQRPKRAKVPGTCLILDIKGLSRNPRDTRGRAGHFGAAMVKEARGPESTT